MDLVQYVCCVLTRSVRPDSSQPRGRPYLARQAPLWDFPGKNIGAVCHFLLQEIFPT